jgi:hypothetical protein
MRLGTKRLLEKAALGAGALVLAHPRSAQYERGREKQIPISQYQLNQTASSQ